MIADPVVGDAEPHSSSSSSSNEMSSSQLISQLESALTSAASRNPGAASAPRPAAQRFREVGNQATWSLSSCKPGKLSRSLFLVKHRRGKFEFNVLLQVSGWSSSETTLWRHIGSQTGNSHTWSTSSSRERPRSATSRSTPTSNSMNPTRHRRYLFAAEPTLTICKYVPNNFTELK